SADVGPAVVGGAVGGLAARLRRIGVGALLRASAVRSPAPSWGAGSSAGGALVIGVACALGVLRLLRRVVFGAVIAVIATSRAASAAASATTRTVRALVVVTPVGGARLVIAVVGIVPVVGVVVFDLHDFGEFGLRHLKDQTSVVGDGGVGARFRRRRGCRGGSGEGIARIEVHRRPAGSLPVVRL